jgi:hypothetical protein
MNIRFIFLTLILMLTVSIEPCIAGYPIDGYPTTGIRRLLRLHLILDGKVKGTMPLPGARKLLSEINLNLLNSRGDSLENLPPKEAQLQARIDALFPNRDESYALALLEITPGRPLRFAARQENRQYAPGSVGKLLIAAGLFAELSKLYPDSIEKRRHLLSTRMIVADQWIRTDTHEVPIFNAEDYSFQSRPIREGDIFSLYEWLDHMLSASSNAAASVVWKELILMRAFGQDYPPDRESEVEFFNTTPRENLRTSAMSIVNDPIRESGIEPYDWQLGSFFTQTGKKNVPGGGGSYATPIGYLKYLVALERGKIVDRWSSLEIKRLMYMTARRIRYASSPALTNAAVYFKSGSLYRCKPEPDFICKKYEGNVENIMNSVIIVEHPDGRTYLLGLMSNILKKNSAVEHQSLATFIDRILAK